MTKSSGRLGLTLTGASNEQAEGKADTEHEAQVRESHHRHESTHHRRPRSPYGNTISAGDAAGRTGREPSPGRPTEVGSGYSNFILSTPALKACRTCALSKMATPK